MAKVNRNMNSCNTDTGNPHAVYDFHWHNLEVESPCRMDAHQVIGPNVVFTEPHSHSWVLLIL
jgi:hypothetical protein